MTPRVVLASGSPRRSELLSQMGLKFEVVISNVDEEALTTSDPWRTAETLARAKALAVRDRLGDRNVIVIGADTVVAIDGREQFAKPADEEDAVRMLLCLSGRTHQVITGVCVADCDKSIVFSDTSEVRFRSLTLAEVDAYVKTGEPMDKAGGYAIQGGAAGFIAGRNGSLSNIIGLPVERLSEELKRSGLDLDRG